MTGAVFCAFSITKTNPAVCQKQVHFKSTWTNEPRSTYIKY